MYDNDILETKLLIPWASIIYRMNMIFTTLYEYDIHQLEARKVAYLVFENMRNGEEIKCCFLHGNTSLSHFVATNPLEKA